MLSLDISRDSFQRPKNYSGLRQQQGRIPLDSELNEGSDIIAEELRRAIKDVICNSGTSDDGFRVSFAVDNDPADYDFNIDAGTYYIGGVRYDCLNSTTFLSQPDWLQIKLDLDPLPGPPATLIGGENRYDFVYMNGWEQIVSGTEDSESLERALVGADGAVRERRMARIEVDQGTAETCIDAMETLFPKDSLDTDTCQLVSGAAITVDFDADDVDENLCAPQTQTGFLGAANETFRVQLTAPDRFIYGRDNAAPLYRVSVQTIPANEDVEPPTPERTLVTFMSRPRDVHSQPLAGQAVELFRWNTFLPNGEKLAEPIGTLANIATDYNPDTGTIEIDLELDADWTSWFAGDGADFINPMDDPDLAEYFYMRVWTGGSGDASQPDHTITAGDLPMPGTSLTVAFADTGVPNVYGDAGEYWVIGARPNAPDVVTPWRLLGASAQTPPPAPPMGPMRHVAPLALIEWVADATGVYHPTVHDCRERFRKLCKVGTCCEITVGDGETSHGDVNDISEAVLRLPEEGGKICLLIGHHEASVDLNGRDNVIFSGCGDKTVWSGLEGGLPLRITDCENIQLKNFIMVSGTTQAVLAGSVDGDTPIDETSGNISFEDVKFYSRDRAAIWINGCDGIRIMDCLITHSALLESRADNPDIGVEPSVFLMGSAIHMEHNLITIDVEETATIGAAPNVQTQPLGGVQIGGQSKDIVLRDNKIIGGKGNGITLGHLEWVPSGSTTTETGTWTLGGGWEINAAGCLVPRFEAIPPDTDTTIDYVPVSGGEVRDLVIENNAITDMGLNGISVSYFFDMYTAPDYISVSNARICGNEITGCLTSDIATPDLEDSYFVGFGAIALAACDMLSVQGNRIHHNGINLAAPSCGVFVLYGAGLKIHDNDIYTNGLSASVGADTLGFGRRGGVNIGWCLTHSTSVTDINGRASPARQRALSMSGNFVDCTHGQALKVLGLGPMSICDNHLIGAGAAPLPQLQAIGALLTLFTPVTSLSLLLTSIVTSPAINRQNFATPSTLLGELIIMAMGGSAVSIFNIAWLEELAGLLNDDQFGGIGVGGETMFNDNQVSLLPNSAVPGMRISSVLVASLDDISISNNQMEIEKDGGFCLVDAFAAGATVRMTANRMQEQLFNSIFSGISHSVLLNTQTENQGTHCFAATNLMKLLLPASQSTIALHNLSLVDLIPLGDNTICGYLTGFLGGLLGEEDTQTGPIDTGVEVILDNPNSETPIKEKSKYQILGGYTFAHRTSMY